MENYGALLYPVMLIIVLCMWLRVRGLNLEEIVKRSADQHHHLNKIFMEHPEGGNWREIEHWVDGHQR
jgi:hypothetical protein